MKKLFVLFCIICFAACSKVSNLSPEIYHRKPFFKNASAAFNLVKKKLKDFHPDENLLVIDKISYMYSGKTAYAIVFFTSNMRRHNLVVAKELDVDSGYVLICDGSDCDCRVKIIINSTGNATVDCNCTTCKKIISNTLDLDGDE